MWLAIGSPIALGGGVTRSESQSVRTVGRRGAVLDLDLEVEQEADRLLLDRRPSSRANMSKPSRWYSTSGSRWAIARRPMPSCR